MKEFVYRVHIVTLSVVEEGSLKEIEHHAISILKNRVQRTLRRLLVTRSSYGEETGSHLNY
jgi:hypothetical protein